MKLLTKTQAAFTFSCETLFSIYSKIYFWTWTFIETPSNDTEAMERFNRLITRLKNYFPLLRGLRVCELHRSHGIHFHLFINIRIPIRQLKRISRGTGMLVGGNWDLGFGRMSVATCNQQTVGYLADYLTKQYRDQYRFGGRRRWGTIGGFIPTRVRDVEFETEETINRKYVFGNAKCGYATFIMMAAYTTAFGHFRDWPEPCKKLIYKQSDSQKAILTNMRELGKQVRQEITQESYDGVTNRMDFYNDVKISKAVLEFSKYLQTVVESQ